MPPPTINTVEVMRRWYRRAVVQADSEDAVEPEQ
jgi:hypothetical protein